VTNLNSILISNDLNLHNLLKTQPELTEISLSRTTDKITGYDVVIVSDRIIEFKEFKKMVDNSVFEDGVKVIYLLTNDVVKELAIMKNYLNSNNIFYVNPKKTNKQVCDSILEIIANKYVKENKIFAFLGADSYTGTSMVAQSVAQDLSLNTDAKVLMFFSTHEPSNDFVECDNKNFYLDSLKDKLISNILSREDFMKSVYVKDGLSYLFGVDDIQDIRHFHPEHIENLLEIAKSEFDIIIVDCGHNLYFGSSICPINESYNRFLVTTPLIKPFNKYKRMRDQLFTSFGLGIESFNLIINKFDDSEYYSVGQVENMYGCKSSSVVPYISEYAVAENERKTIFELGNKSFVSSINEVSYYISNATEFEYNMIKKSKTKLFGFLKG
jgi:Flp pilus assembly CpaE family ATPase